MLKLHRCPDPVVPDGLVRMYDDGVALTSEYFESTNDLGDMVYAVDLHQYQHPITTLW